MDDGTDKAEGPVAERKPLWRRVIDFPIVSLIIAIAAIMAAVSAVGPFLKWLPVEHLPKWFDIPLTSLSIVAVCVAVYKLLIVRLGEHPREDLPFDRTSADSLRGAAIALVLMSAIVGLAALAGAYGVAGWGGSTSLPMLLFAAGLQAGITEEILARTRRAVPFPRAIWR